MTSPERLPRRADSVLSTTSSGSRTVRAPSRSSRRRRRSSASINGASSGTAGGIFARLRGGNKSADKNDDEDEDEERFDQELEEGGEDGLEENEFNKEMRMWRQKGRSGSGGYGLADEEESEDGVQMPPKGWRQASDSFLRDGEDPEQGPSDYWRRPSSPTYLDAEMVPLPSSKTPSGHDDRVERYDDEEDDDAVDESSYARRMRDILNPPATLPSTASTPRRGQDGPEIIGTARVESVDGSALGEGSDRDVFASAKVTRYDEVYRDIVGEKAGSVEVGDEEFGVLRATPTPDTRDEASDDTPSISSRIASQLYASPSPKRPSYLHPSVSRLRSHLRSTSASTQLSPPRGLHARTPSHFSQVSMSRSDSISTASIAGPSRPPDPIVTTPDLTSSLQLGGGSGPSISGEGAPLGPAFTFHPLRHLSAHLFGRLPQSRGSDSPVGRRSSVLGLPVGKDGEEKSLGVPTVMDVRGMIAVGTDGGWAVVYGFGQDVKCVLGTEAITTSSGPVTAITISPDQTFVGVGHATGTIYLYDLSSPSKPARTVQPLALRQVLGGRKEGHLQGSAILHMGFVGKRHTSIVTGDADGRAFWWSLGRVMGVESNDVVRMLGSYPDPSTPTPGSLAVPSAPGSPGTSGLVPSANGAAGHRKSASTTSSMRSHPTKRPTTLFAALPLPLGENPHRTDTFNFSALLTPGKLVVVAMKPSPKTWFRRMRDTSGGPMGGSTGCAVWLRAGEVDEAAAAANSAASAGQENTTATATTTPSDPVLAYSWGSSVRFLRVRIGEDATPEFVEGKKWEAPSAIRAMQWYDPDHLLLVTSSSVILLNVRSTSAVEDTPLQTKLLTSHDSFASLSRRAGDLPPPPDIAGSVRAHRSKLFLLTRSNVQVGSLMHWNDRILSRVHAGDFLGAISLALAYFDDRAGGNHISLPHDPEERRDVVGRRVRELIRASLAWAFSEERMRDDTHYSADGRGVDLTTLFEGLATACVEAAVAMADGPLLFDEAYEHFGNVGIQGILLGRLESAFFEGTLPPAPPHIVQALIRKHDDSGEYALAEAVIWHADSSALDINQAVTLCESHGLWDALIHVYTRAMGDYVAPIVRLLALVRAIEKARAERPTLVGGGGGGKGGEDDDAMFERMAPGAYKLYAYLEAILCGCSYPSGHALEEVEAERARAEAYAFVFSDRTVAWPSGASGEPILTSTSAVTPSTAGGSLTGDREWDNAVWGEPTYPYLRLLLRFDTEAFLHAMDGAFEDPYLNDVGRSAMNRQSIINLMLEVVDPVVRSDQGDIGVDDSLPSTPGGSTPFHSSDITLLHIFVARNLPKYPQFIFIPPSTLHRILVSLSEDSDQSTTEDRQLAAESLLSAYTPHDADAMLARFEKAGFFRILRGAYEREHKWTKLISVLVRDPDADQSVFDEIERVVKISSIKTKAGSTTIPPDVVDAVSEALPQLLDVSVRQTASTLDRAMPSLHENAVSFLSTSEHKQVAYLGVLLDPTDDEHHHAPHPAHTPSLLPLTLRHAYVSLLGKHDSSALVPFLDRRGGGFFDLPLLAAQSEDSGATDAAVWALDRSGQTKTAIRVADDAIQVGGADLAHAVAEADEGGAHVAIEKLRAVTRMAVRLCREHSTASGTAAAIGGAKRGTPSEVVSAKGEEGVDLEDMWYTVLHAITELVHAVSAVQSDDLAHRRSTSGMTLSNGARGPQNGALNVDTTDGPDDDHEQVDRTRVTFAHEDEQVGPLALEAVKSLVHETLGSLVSTSGALSFPRLFKRLVDASPVLDADSASAGVGKHSSNSARGGRAYAQFRTILRGMLDSYATETEVLRLSVRLVGADTAESFGEAVRARSKGWASWKRDTECEVCGKSCIDSEESVRPGAAGKGKGGASGKRAKSGKGVEGSGRLFVFADGRVKHASC